MNLLSGWNLVSSPVDGTVSTSSFNDAASQSGGKAVVWALKKDGSDWETVGGVFDLEPGRGIWVKADSAKTVEFSNITKASTAFKVNNYIATLSGSAYQLGTPESTTLRDLTIGASAVWLFDTAANNWVGFKQGASGDGGETDFDSDGYFRGNANSIVANGTGYWYLK